MNLYIHSPTLLHGGVINSLNTITTLVLHRKFIANQNFLLVRSGKFDVKTAYIDSSKRDVRTTISLLISVREVSASILSRNIFLDISKLMSRL
jgi:hypothetical protein